MASFVHNPTIRQFLCALCLLTLLSFSAYPQDNQPTLEAALALTDPVARIEALQKYLQVQPDAPNAETARAELTRAFAYAGEIRLTEKNIDGALQSFKQAIAAFPKQVDDKFFDEVAIRIPLAISVRGYRTEAILLAREMEARLAKEPQRLATLGEFYLKLEAPDEALRTLNAASKLAPNDAPIYRALGSAYRLHLNLEEAAAQYKSAIKADPNDRRAYFELANLQRAQGRYDVAINLYNHQLSIEPGHIASLKGSALAHLAQGKEAKAEELLAQAAKVSNTNLQQDNLLQTQLAFVYLARGNVAKARQATSAALSIEPRYSWSRIAAAEIELSENKYFEAERHILDAMRYADFPTLHFALGKIYLAVEDFDGALEQFSKAFSYKSGKYQTRLGGVLETSAASVAELLAPERQASLFQAEPITTDVEFKLAENLTRLDDTLKRSKKSSPGTVSSLVLNQASTKLAAAESEKASTEFAETEGTRKAFRWLYSAERLLQGSQSLETALRFSEQALEMAEIATTPEGSLRDLPNYDRAARLQVFRGRALTLRGRALLKLGRKPESIAALEEAVDMYGTAPERKTAQWQLAMAKESAGKNEEALNLYISAYEPPEKNSVGADLNRTVIESVYRKIHGSLAGLDDRIGKALESALLAKSTRVEVTPTPVSPPPVATENAPATEAVKPAETVAAETNTAEKNAAEKSAELVVAPTETKIEAPIILPEARAVALALVADAPSTIEFNSSLAFESEDAPLPVEVEKPKAEIAAAATAPITSSTIEAAPAITLPEARVLALALSSEQLAQIDLAPALTIETDDAPPPPAEATANKLAEASKPAEEVKATETPTIAEANKPTEEVKVTEAPAVAEANKPGAEIKPTEAALAVIELPPPGTIPYVVLPALDLEPLMQFDIAALFPAEADPAPTEIAPVKATEVVTTTTTPAPTRNNIAEPKEIAPPTNTAGTALSDSRVAEIEKAIEASVTAPGGKKGNSISAGEESVIGHIEGDLPIRIKGQPKIDAPPAGVSGHADTELKPLHSEKQSSGLPPEVERRASEMGQSAGKMSAGAAMEIEVPDKPVGPGRKGITPTTQTADEEEKPKPARPRRVKESQQ